jgi:xanthine dehydrogenase accessory factor
MDSELIKRIQAAIDANTAAVLVSVVGIEGSTPAALGARMLVYPDRAIFGTVGGGSIELQAIRTAASGQITAPRRIRFSLTGEQTDAVPTGMVCGGWVELLFEPLARTEHLYIVGGGHCAVELAPLARKAGFEVTVIDNRPEWANSEKHPSVHVLCVPYAEVGPHIRFSGHSYVVIMTHGHRHDEEVLRQCLGRELKYLGMIGSRKKTQRCFDSLLAEGRSREELSRVYAPVGFGIGSMTPIEIAISISAQLIAVRNGISAMPFSSNPLTTPA